MQQQPAADASGHRQQLFDALHGEVVAEARGVAQELRVDVRAIAFRPDGGVAVHDFLGVPPEARARLSMRELVARDVSAMRPAELAQHAARLQALRAAVVCKLQEKEAEKKADDGEGKVQGDEGAGGTAGEAYRLQAARLGGSSTN